MIGRADLAIGSCCGLGHGSNRGVGGCQSAVDVIKQELEELSGVLLKFFVCGALVVQLMNERDRNK